MKIKVTHIETIGTLCGIVGSFLVAFKLGNLGYPLFFASSLCLLVSAIKLKQKNFISLQAVFLTANIAGLINHF